MKNKRGGVLILLGLLMVAAAAVLAAFNCYDQNRAAKAAAGAAAELRAILAGGEDVSGSTAGEDEVSTAGAAGEEAVAPEEVPDSGEEESDAAQDSEEISETSVPDYVLSPDAEMPVQKIQGRNYIGILQIPAHGLELPILAEWSYPGLQVAPCRYSGSAYKGNTSMSRKAAAMFRSRWLASAPTRRRSRRKRALRSLRISRWACASTRPLP